MSTKRDIVWSVSAKTTMSSLPEATRKSFERIVKLLSENPLPEEFSRRLHKVKKDNEPNMHYFRFGTKYRVFLDVFSDHIEVLAIVDSKALTQLVRSIDRV